MVPPILKWKVKGGILKKNFLQAQTVADDHESEILGMNCQRCKHQPAVLQDRLGLLCAKCWMDVQTFCRQDAALSSGLERDVTQRNSKMKGLACQNSSLNFTLNWATINSIKSDSLLVLGDRSRARGCHE